MITPNHVYAGSNKIDLTVDTKYVHPAAKQCNYVYTHPTTKQCNYSYTHPSTIQCSAASEISSFKSSVSSGKAQIASAITGKGISTSSTASFSTMASNIRALNILDPIYQNVIDNTKIQSECVGSAYHSSYKIAELISGSTSFTVGGEEYSLFTGSNGEENAVVCWRQTSSGGTSDYIFS